MTALAAAGIYNAFQDLRQEVASPTWQALLLTVIEDTLGDDADQVNIPASVEAWLDAADVDPLHAPSFKGFPSSVDGLFSKVGAPPLSPELIKQAMEQMTMLTAG
jgi:hypothetical protein